MKYNTQYFTTTTEKSQLIYERYLNLLNTENISFDGKTVLDIGCATGIFKHVLPTSTSYYGIDISKYAIETCKKKFPNIKDQFYTYDINHEFKITDKTFDIITIFDVIEHLQNFLPLTTFINKHLKRNGVLIITTPNAHSFTRFLKHKSYTGELDKTHKMLFTPYTLDFFLTRSQLKKKTIFTPYHFYFNNSFITQKIPFGGQIFAIYNK